MAKLTNVIDSGIGVYGKANLSMFNQCIATAGFVNSFFLAFIRCYLHVHEHVSISAWIISRNKRDINNNPT